MQKLKLGHPIPECFEFERICMSIESTCCDSVIDIVEHQYDELEFRQGELSVVIQSPTSGDVTISKISTKQSLVLAQAKEVDLFGLLLKYAYEAGRLEDILFPIGAIGIVSLLGAFEDIKDSRDIDDVASGIFSQPVIPNLSLKTESYNQIKKKPHWGEIYYKAFIDKRSGDLLLWDESTHKNNRNDMFRVSVDEVQGYLRLLLNFSENQAGRGYPGNFKYIIQYMFSEDINRALGTAEKRAKY